MKVENVDGEKIGRVHDLIVELRSGMPEYVIVRSGRVVLGHRRSVIVPISAIALKTAKAGIAAVDISRQQWRYAPEFSRKDLNWIGQPEKARQIARFYGRGESVPHIAKTAERENGDLSSTGHADGPVTVNQPGRYGLASELIGREVIARQHADVGSISDLLVNTAEMKPAFAIVSASRPAATSTSFAVPVQLLRPMPGDKVAVNANHQDFEHAKPIRESETSEGRQNEIYRYER
jgi:sporulation protein YlmC with PRC-barrel domain